MKNIKIFVAWFLVMWVMFDIATSSIFLLIEKNWLVDFSDWVLAILLSIFIAFGWFFALRWAFKEISKYES